MGCITRSWPFVVSFPSSTAHTAMGRPPGRNTTRSRSRHHTARWKYSSLRNKSNTLPYSIAQLTQHPHNAQTDRPMATPSRPNTTRCCPLTSYPLFGGYQKIANRHLLWLTRCWQIHKVRSRFWSGFIPPRTTLAQLPTQSQGRLASYWLCGQQKE
jgi:hypothetical protein